MSCTYNFITMYAYKCIKIIISILSLQYSESLKCVYCFCCVGGGLRGRNHFGHWMVTLNYSTGYAHGGKTFTEFITEMGGGPNPLFENET